MDLNTVIDKIEKSSSLDFGNIFSNSIELFKKVWVQGFITLLLTMVCILPFYLILYIPMIVFGISDPEMLRHEELSPPFIIGMIIAFPIVMFGIITVSLALQAAFMRICRLKDLEEMGDEDYFYYFKNGRLRNVVILAMIYLGLTLLGMLLCGIGLIYMMVPLALVPAFLAFNEELAPMEQVKASFKLGNKNWLVIFGLLIVMGIVAELGVILCLVGVFFTAMLAKIPVYFMYKDSMGFPLEE